MLTGLFWFPDGGHPVSRDWPLNRFSMSREGVQVEPSTFLGGPRLSFAWSEIERVERTARGLRFRFAERGKSFVVGSPRGAKRLLQLAGWYCPPEIFESAVHTVAWWR